MPRLATLLLRAIAAFAAIVVVLYLADYLILRMRSSPTSTVTVRPYLSVPRKDGRLEFLFQDPRDESCVNSLFPHLGLTPCWYLQRHSERRINL